jgi:hypothetical protein
MPNKWLLVKTQAALTLMMISREEMDKNRSQEIFTIGPPLEGHRMPLKQRSLKNIAALTSHQGKTNTKILGHAGVEAN